MSRDFCFPIGFGRGDREVDGDLAVVLAVVLTGETGSFRTTRALEDVFLFFDFLTSLDVLDFAFLGLFGISFLGFNVCCVVFDGFFLLFVGFFSSVVLGGCFLGCFDFFVSDAMFVFYQSGRNVQ